ncbi:MAG: penicillin-binding protein 2 [Pseudomonadota bacterium]|jgi:penicillin-binding protein 2|nr:penicillin-binding protein 2 [Alphaproteobacteria bacterium]
MINEQFGPIFKRRSFILGLSKSILITGLLGRLVHLQIFNRDHYRTLADRNRIQTRFITAPRGQIIDNVGKPLAINQNVYRCLMTPYPQLNIEEELGILESILSLSPKQIKDLRDQLTHQSKIATIIKENLTWDEIAALQLKLPDLPGLLIERSQIRQYVYPEILCHTIGYVAQASQKDLTEHNLDPIPGLRIGKNGLEKTFENSLCGSPGFQRVEVNAKRRIVRIIDNTPPKIGQDLQTTLNFELQEKIIQILEPHRNASVVVMDVNTGAIRAMVSKPGFDSNLFVKGIQKDVWKSLLTHEDNPLINKPLAGQYAPGSIFKMMVALAGLYDKAIDRDTQVFCPGHFNLGSHTFHCWTWNRGGHGTVNLEKAIAESCDVYFYNVALKIGALKMVEMASRFHLGQLTGIELDGEKKGLIPSLEWAKFRKGFFKQKGQALNISIGQGVVLCTPLQMVRMIAMLVNGGKILTPYLVEKNSHQIPEKFVEGIDPSWLEWIQQAMNKCVNDPRGTASRANLKLNDWTFGGKSGSAQVCRITMQQRADGTYKDLPYHLKDHAIFVGYAPIEKPQHAVSVVIEHGKSGGGVAGPVAGEVLNAARHLYV